MGKGINVTHLFDFDNILTIFGIIKFGLILYHNTKCHKNEMPKSNENFAKLINIHSFDHP